MGFPGGTVINPPANAGDMDSIPELGRSPGEGNGKPFQYSCLENLHGQKNVVGHSSWGQKESDRTEHAYTLYKLFLKSSSQILFLSLVLLSTLVRSKVTEPVFRIHSGVGMPLYAQEPSLLSPLSIISTIKEKNPPTFTLL